MVVAVIYHPLVLLLLFSLMVARITVYVDFVNIYYDIKVFTALDDIDAL